MEQVYAPVSQSLRYRLWVSFYLLLSFTSTLSLQSRYQSTVWTNSKSAAANAKVENSVLFSTGASTESSLSGKIALKNLKTAPGQYVETDKLGILDGWKELQGLSELDLLRSSSYTQAEATDRESKALKLAYKRCEYVTELFSKTFYVGTSLMREGAREKVWAIYAWCRRTDDIVDSPRALLNSDVLAADLREWNDRLEDIWNQKPRDLFDMALADSVKCYPTLSIVPFQDMIKGMIMDVPGSELGQERYDNFDDLYVYCYRVAGTVGLMTLPVLGTAEGYTEEQAKEPALALGIGLQLTNILRDVGEDLERGRIYLPQDELKAFGIKEEDLFACKVTDNYISFMKFQIQRARDYYRIAAEGIPMLAPSARFAVQASLDLYSRILNIIEKNGYDNLRKRAYTTKLEKAAILPSSFLKSKGLMK